LHARRLQETNDVMKLRTLHEKELCNLFGSTIITMGWAGHADRMGELITLYGILVR